MISHRSAIAISRYQIDGDHGMVHISVAHARDGNRSRRHTLETDLDREGIYIQSKACSKWSNLRINIVVHLYLFLGKSHDIDLMPRMMN